MERIRALQKEHGLRLPEEFPFRYAQTAMAAGSYQEAIEAVTQYLSKVGREGKHYREALALRVKSRRGLREPAFGLASGDSVPGVAGTSRDQGRPKTRERLPYEPEMVEIPGGSFRMGCVSGRDCGDDELPVRAVRVARFELSKYEVTFEEYDRFTVATGRGGADDDEWGRGRRPVINVSWEAAVAYTRWLSEQTGERYRLPSEAEWEYAARAGTETKYHYGNDESRLCEYGNHADTSTNYGWRNKTCSDGVGDRTAAVGTYRSNAFGLFDMHGNV
jgi:formylglycine-generating enzyme required for sulfatase activity